MSEQLAKDLAVVGPVARGSNVPYDVRHAAPYLMYKEAKVTPIVEKGGDYLLQIKANQPKLFKRAQALDRLQNTPFLSKPEPDTDALNNAPSTPGP